jgi:flagellar motor switch protein FliN
MSRATEPDTSEAATLAATLAAGAPPIGPSTRPEGADPELAREVLARKASFPPVTPVPPAGAAGAMPFGFLMDVTVTLTAELGRTTLTLGDVLRLGSGSVVPLDRLISEPVEISARGVLLARGEVVVVDDRFAVRIKEIIQTRPAPAGEAG